MRWQLGQRLSFIRGMTILNTIIMNAGIRNGRNYFALCRVKLIPAIGWFYRSETHSPKN